MSVAKNLPTALVSHVKISYSSPHNVHCECALPLQEQGFQDARKLVGKCQKHNVSKGSSSIAHNLMSNSVGSATAAALYGREYTDAVSAACYAQVPQL